MFKIIFGITGASGIPLASMILKFLHNMQSIETHVIVSRNAKLVCREENSDPPVELENLANYTYDEYDFAAGPASGSWQCQGMIICPCSVASLAAVATGAGRNLIHRSADVMLKERRPLIIVVRETPLNLIHLRNMTALAEAGAIIMPFMPAFYTGSTNLREMAKEFTGRMLDILKIDNSLSKRWQKKFNNNTPFTDTKVFF